MKNLVKQTSLGLALTILLSTGANAFCDFNAAKKTIIDSTLENRAFTEKALSSFAGKPVSVTISDIKTGAGASGEVTEVFITYTQTVTGAGDSRVDGVSYQVLKAEFSTPSNCSIYNGSGATVR